MGWFNKNFTLKTKPDESVDIAGSKFTVDASKGKVTETVTLNAATGNEIAHTLSYTTNKASSGNDTGLKIAMTDTASPGTSLPLDVQVGGATKFSVNQAGNTTVAGTLDVTSTVTFTATKSDGIAFIPAVEAYTLYAGTTPWTRVLIRAAAGDWGVQQTSGNNDNTMQIAFPIGKALRRTTASKGIKITGFKVAHSITNAQDLGAGTVTLNKTVYSTSANAVTDMPVTGALSVTKNASYLDAFAVTTPYWMVDANSDFVIDIAIAATTATCVWKVYGVYVTYEIATY